MSRTEVHAYMEAHSGETLEDSVKDTYLNLCKTQVMSDMMPWGSSHLQTVETTDTIDSTVSVSSAGSSARILTVTINVFILFLSIYVLDHTFLELS